MQPKLSHATILAALRTFDSSLRETSAWSDWEGRKSHKYAIQHEGRNYPVKHIASMASGIPVSQFSGGRYHTNQVVEHCGYEVVSLVGRVTPTHYLVYWRPSTLAGYTPEHLVNHAASNQFQKIKPKDVLWIVSAPEGQLHLLGQLTVGRVVGQKEAERSVGHSLWEANFHALAAQGAANTIRWIPLRGIAGKLRFASTTSSRLAVRGGLTNGQQMQALRQLTDESISLLRAAWDTRTAHRLPVSKRLQAGRPRAWIKPKKKEPHTSSVAPRLKGRPIGIKAEADYIHNRARRLITSRRRHHVLTNAFVSYLGKAVQVDESVYDIVVRKGWKPGRLLLVEAKSEVTGYQGRHQVREAIGQLFDYRFLLVNVEHERNVDLALLAPEKPSQDLIRLCSSELGIHLIWRTKTAFSGSPAIRNWLSGCRSADSPR